MSFMLIKVVSVDVWNDLTIGNWTMERKHSQTPQNLAAGRSIIMDHIDCRSKRPARAALYDLNSAEPKDVRYPGARTPATLPGLQAGIFFKTRGSNQASDLMESQSLVPSGGRMRAHWNSPVMMRIS